MNVSSSGGTAFPAAPPDFSAVAVTGTEPVASNAPAAIAPQVGKANMHDRRTMACPLTFLGFMALFNDSGFIVSIVGFTANVVHRIGGVKRCVRKQ